VHGHSGSRALERNGGNRHSREAQTAGSPGVDGSLGGSRSDSSGAPAAVRIGRFVTGASKSLLPDGSAPRFDWVWNVYHATHSALVFAIWFGVWLLVRKPWLEMLAWALHIRIDIFTHTGMFAIRFLWPLSPVHVNGTPWERPWLLALNYAVLASAYLVLWRRRGRASAA